MVRRSASVDPSTAVRRNTTALQADHVRGKADSTASDAYVSCEEKDAEDAAHVV